MKPIYIKYAKGKKARMGGSKFLGKPDVWPGFKWPTGIDDEGYDYALSFVAQINCAEASKYDKNGAFPKTGMLYFFYDLVDKPYSTDEVDDGVRVLYYDGDMSALRPVERADKDDEGPVEYREMPIAFTDESGDECHQLLGDSYYLDTDFPAPKGKTLLFGLGEIIEDDFEITFVDCGILLIFIDPKKLKNKDFSDVEYRLAFM